MRSYRSQAAPNGQQTPRPEWVETALRRSLAYLQTEQASENGLSNVNDSFSLRTADQDDLNMTHLRLDQVQNGVPVFGGQLTTHIVEQTGDISSMGRVFKAAEQVETKPGLTSDQAIEKAKQALRYNGEFHQAPTAELTILPDWMINQSGDDTRATLTYLVKLLILDGTPNSANHYYFINAQTGDVALHYDNMQRQNATGTGYSYFSGTVSFNTYDNGNSFELEDITRCPLFSQSGCINNSIFSNLSSTGDSGSGQVYSKSINVWGNGSMSDPQTVAVDVHYGMNQTWDYFLNKHGRFGIDNNGYPIKSWVHHDNGLGSNSYGASWLYGQAYFTDGNGTTHGPSVSIDAVAHEITHGLTENTAMLSLNPGSQSAALNESFSDIFGTAVEFYVGTINGRVPNYYFGEAYYTPATPCNYSPPPGGNIHLPNKSNCDAERYLDNPPHDGHSFGYLPSNPNGQDRYNLAGVQNKAFYLLTQASYGGQDRAERIFYRALTLYLTSSATFRDARCATLRSANHLHGHMNVPGCKALSLPARAVDYAWADVGVTSTTP